MYTPSTPRPEGGDDPTGGRGGLCTVLKVGTGRHSSGSGERPTDTSGDPFVIFRLGEEDGSIIVSGVPKMLGGGGGSF